MVFSTEDIDEGMVNHESHSLFVENVHVVGIMGGHHWSRRNNKRPNSSLATRTAKRARRSPSPDY